MPVTEPTQTLTWAETPSPAVDPVSGQPPIIIPTTTKQDNGFARLERPPRQDVNWFFNLAGRWVQWFKQELDLNLAAIGLNTAHRTSDGQSHGDVVLNNTHRAITAGNPHGTTAAQISDFAAGVTNSLDSEVPTGTWTPNSGTITVGSKGVTVSKLGSGSGRTIFVEIFAGITVTAGSPVSIDIELATAINSMTSLQGEGTILYETGGTFEIARWETVSFTKLRVKRLNGAAFPVASIQFLGTAIMRTFT